MMKLDFTLNGLMQMVNPEDLQGAISTLLYDSAIRCATTCHMEHAQRAAACWALSRLRDIGPVQAIEHIRADDVQQLMRMALIKRTVYELGITSEYKQDFYSEKTDADVLMDGVRRFTVPVYEV